MNRKENCLGGFSNEICLIGHIGALCEACDILGLYYNGRKFAT